MIENLDIEVIARKIAEDFLQHHRDPISRREISSKLDSTFAYCLFEQLGLAQREALSTPQWLSVRGHVERKIRAAYDAYRELRDRQ